MSVLGWKHKHTSLAIVFMIWIVSYLDRMVMSTAIPYIASDFGLSSSQMGGIMSAFAAGYAICQIPGGILSDRFGPRKVLTWAIVWWSALTAVTGAVGKNLFVLQAVRFLFGVGEGVAPAAIWRALANWTPGKNRALANSIMMSSNSLGPALAPLFVVSIMADWGWRTVFYVLFIPGLLMALWVWFKLPDNPADKKGITQEELDELKLDTQPVEMSEEAAKMSFWQVLAVPAVWKTFLILFFSNMATWGFISWVPSYLKDARGFDMKAMGLAASYPFFAGTIAMLIVGWLLNSYFRRIPQILLIVFEVCAAICLYQTVTTVDVNHMLLWNTTAGFFIYAGVAVVFSMPMAAVPKSIAGRAMGIVNTAGQAAGFVAPLAVGLLIVDLPDGTKDFSSAFYMLCCSALVAAFLCLFYRPTKDAV